MPRVPLPTLDDSCAKFIEWCAPLLTADELAETQQAVDSFRRPGGPGGKVACGTRALRRRRRNPQLARHFLAVQVPRTPRPDRVERELLLLVLGHGPATGRTRGRTHRRCRQLQGATRSRRSITPLVPARSGALDGAEQVPVLHNAHPGTGPGHGPSALHRSVAWLVHVTSHHRVLPRKHVPHAGFRTWRPAPLGRRSHRGTARGHEGGRDALRRPNRPSGTSPRRHARSGRRSRQALLACRP